MAHANKTYVSNGGTVGISSLFPDGDAAPPSTGIKIVGTIADGSTVKIIAGSDVDFGDVAPIFMFRTLLQNSTAGADYELTEGVTYKKGYNCSSVFYQSAYKMPVHAVVGMPHDKALAIGSLSSTPDDITQIPILNVIGKAHSNEFFQFCSYQFPIANQANNNSYLNDGSQHAIQIKNTWHMNTNNGDSVDSELDIYRQVFGWYPGTVGNGWTGNWKNELLLASNSAGISPIIGADGAGYIDLKISDTEVNRNPILHSHALRVDASTGFFESKMLDTTYGQLSDLSQVYTDTITGNNFFDRLKIPAFVAGFNVPLNRHTYLSSVYEAWGSAARARVTVTNNIVVGSETTESVATPLHWSNKVLVVEIDLGYTATALRIYGADGNYITGASI